MWSEVTALDVAVENNRHDVINLLREYQKNPAFIRHQIRTEKLVSKIFILMILVSDTYLCVPEVYDTASLQNATKDKRILSMIEHLDDHIRGCKKSKIVRFFNICDRVPIELKMLIANLMFGCAKKFVLTKEFELYLSKMIYLNCI